MYKPPFFKKTICLAPWILLAAAASPLVAQQATVSLGSVSGAPGAIVNLTVSLAASGTTQPGTLQWTMSYPSDITSVTVTAGTSAVAGNKSISCSSKPGSTICVAWGVNANVISNGPLATAAFQLASSTVNTSEAVQVTNVMASTAGGMGIPASGVGSTISVTSTTTPDFTLSASPSSQTVVPGGSTSYNVAITPTGGFTGSVTVSVSGLPTGATGSYTTASHTLSVSTSTSTSAGSYTLTIQGASGALT